MARGILQDKSFSFSILIVKACNTIIQDKKEYILTRQLIRSGTSIGANIEEAFGASSQRDFLNKIYISYKEAREAKYWIRLLSECNYIDANVTMGLVKRIDELLRLLNATILKVKANLN